MANDNEQLKANLQTGADKFGAAATNMQTIQDTVNNIIKALSPQEQTFVGDASDEFGKTLDSWTTYSTDAIKALQDTSSACIQLKQAIEDAERQAEDEARRNHLGDIMTLVLGVVLLPVAANAVGGALDANTASAALRLLTDADKKIAAIFQKIATSAKQFVTDFKTALPDAQQIKPVTFEPFEAKLPADVTPPTKVSKPAPQAGPEAFPHKLDPQHMPSVPPGEKPVAYPQDRPNTPEGVEEHTNKGEVKLKHDSGVHMSLDEQELLALLGKPKGSKLPDDPNHIDEFVKDMAPQEPLQVYPVHPQVHPQGANVEPLIDEGGN